MSSRTMSARICGVGMFASRAFANLRLRNSADALQNPELEQARHSRNGEQHRRCQEPTAERGATAGTVIRVVFTIAAIRTQTSNPKSNHARYTAPATIEPTNAPDSNRTLANQF